MKTLFYNIKKLYWFEQNSTQNSAKLKAEDHVGLLVENGKFSKVLSAATADSVPADLRVNLNHSIVMPGFVDSHTHLLFGGDRSSEFESKLEGKSYQQIANSGGGIVSTFRQTKNTSTENLNKILDQRLMRHLKTGVTSLETKSGYGENIEEEIRLLKIIQDHHSPQKIVATCLGLHAVPKETSKHEYIEKVSTELLPEVARLSLATYADAFIENGYFSVDDAEPYIKKAQDLGLKIRLHVDEFSDTGGAAAAARWQAHSADHMQFSNPTGLKAMAEAGVFATLLPGTSLYSKIPFTQAHAIRDAGCKVVIASDFNPGSCGFFNLPFLAMMAAIHNGLTLDEALRAITLYAAQSLGLKHKGNCAPGYDADFVVYDSYESIGEWGADLAQKTPAQVWIQGKRFV